MNGWAWRVEQDRAGLWVRLPLSPLPRDLRGLHWARMPSKRLGLDRVVAQLADEALGPDRPRPWARAAEVEVTIYRCRPSSRGSLADPDNVQAGAKWHIDALWRAGVIDDDRELRYGAHEDRPKGRWGELDGPGTWLRIRRLTGEEG